MSTTDTPAELSRVRADAGRLGAKARWSPDARTAEAIRMIVARAPELTEVQRRTLRAALRRPSTSEAGAR